MRVFCCIAAVYRNKVDAGSEMLCDKLQLQLAILSDLAPAAVSW